MNNKKWCFLGVVHLVLPYMAKKINEKALISILVAFLDYVT